MLCEDSESNKNQKSVRFEYWIDEDWACKGRLLVPIVGIKAGLVRNKGWQGWKLEPVLQIKQALYQTSQIPLSTFFQQRCSTWVVEVLFYTCWWFCGLSYGKQTYHIVVVLYIHPLYSENTRFCSKHSLGRANIPDCDLAWSLQGAFEGRGCLSANYDTLNLWDILTFWYSDTPLPSPQHLGQGSGEIKARHLGKDQRVESDPQSILLLRSKLGGCLFTKTGVRNWDSRGSEHGRMCWELRQLNNI